MQSVSNDWAPRLRVHGTKSGATPEQEGIWFVEAIEFYFWEDPEEGWRTIKKRQQPVGVQQPTGVQESSVFVRHLTYAARGAHELCFTTSSNESSLITLSLSMNGNGPTLNALLDSGASNNFI